MTREELVKLLSEHYEDDPAPIIKAFDVMAMQVILLRKANGLAAKMMDEISGSVEKYKAGLQEMIDQLTPKEE